MPRSNPWGSCLLVGAALSLASGVGAAATGPKAAGAGQSTAVHQPGCDRFDTLAPCEVSWYRLLSSPAAYNGKIVGITGYLVSDFGNLILYPDKAAYASGSDASSVILGRPLAIPRNIADKAAADGCMVYVLGRFTSEGGIAGFNTPRAGGLYEIHKIISMRRVPSDEPLDVQGIRILPAEGGK